MGVEREGAAEKENETGTVSRVRGKASVFPRITLSGPLSAATSHILRAFRAEKYAHKNKIVVRLRAS